MSDQKKNRNIMGALLPKAKKPKIDPTASMSFLEHLEELRWRILKALLGILVGIVIAFVFSDFIVREILLAPTFPDFYMYKLFQFEAAEMILQNRRIVGQFLTYMVTGIVSGIIIGSPIMFYQLYAFLAPALEMGEKIKTFLNVAFISFFFFFGVAFGYLVIVPIAVQFFVGFELAENINNWFDIYDYLKSVTMWVLCCGILFQIPVVSYYLSRLGVLTPEFLRQYRRYAIVFILFLSAFLTPPDPGTQILIAIPLVFLYQFAIYISKIGNRQYNKAYEKAMYGEEKDSQYP